MTRTMATPLRVLMLSLVLMIVLFDRAETLPDLPEFPDFETHSRITLSEKRGYKDVLIAIADTVPEDGNLIDKIKEVFTEFSKFLYSATNLYGHGVFFENASILIPSDWSDDPRYVSRTWETFEASDVRVDSSPTNPLSGRNRPSTNKPTSCGAPGLFIHLTPDYITDNAAARPYGDRSKALTHEWGHFRWGVFDEYPLPGDQHFYSTLVGTYEATKCVSAITGTNRRADGSQCSLDPISGQPDEECRFLDDRRQNKTCEASLMYKQFLPEMRTFCDIDVVTGFLPSITHNALAPNQQNIQCASRSIWEVMREHSDFPSTVSTGPLPAVGALPPINAVPNFRLVKPRRSHEPIVLVLDTSGSMRQAQRLHVLRQALFNLITHVLREDQLFAVVTFNHMTRVDIDLAEVGQDRRRLLEALPKVATGGNAIGGGILEGIDVLMRKSPDYSRATMILLTDDEEAMVPFIQNISDSQLDGIIVHTIAIGPDATSELEGLANRTRGRTFEHSDGSAALFNIFRQVVIRDVSDGITILSRAFVIQNFKTQFSPGNFSGDKMTILVGLPLRFLSYTTVYVTKPNGDLIGNNSQPASTDRFEEIPDFELIQIDTEVVSGVWELSVEFTSVDSNSLTGTIHVETSRRQSSGRNPPIGIAASWGLPTIDRCQIQTVQVTVSRGYTPVADANVEVLVSRPNMMEPTVMLEVYDDGHGADVRKDDGVYTAFFTDFKGNGRYNMEVSVTGEENVTELMNGNRVGVSPSAPDRDQFTGHFNRSISGSSFTCTDEELCSGDSDIYPPYRITDLRVTLLGNMTAQLTFTATGDDLDRGTASRYEIRVAKNIKDLVRRFDSTQVVGIIGSAPPFVSSGDLDAPQPSRQPERFEVKLPDEVGEFSYIFGIVAVDEEGSRSQPSNFASVTANPVGASLIVTSSSDDITPSSDRSIGASLIVTSSSDDITPSSDRSIRASPVVIIIISILFILVIMVLVLAISLYRRRNMSEGDEDTEDAAEASDYADRIYGGAPVDQVYIAPSETAEPIRGMRNPVFNRDDPDAPVQSPSGLDYGNRHALNMMEGRPAGPAPPQGTEREEENTRKAPELPPRLMARPRASGHRGALDADQSDDEHDRDGTCPTRVTEISTQEENGSDKNYYERVD